MNNEEKILTMLIQMQEDIAGIKSTQGEMQEDIVGIKSTQGEMQEDIAGIKSTQGEMQEDIAGIKSTQGEMQEDIAGIKSTQGEMQEDISELKNDVTGIKLRLELDVEKRFDAVNEGIDSILAQLTPKSRVDELESDMVVLKTAVKMLTQEVAELKKAQ